MLDVSCNLNLHTTMKRELLTIFCFALVSITTGQKISVANDKMNIFYIGVDNPISFAAVDVPKNSLVVKSTNGTISNEYGYYAFRSDSVGPADIILYKKTNGKLKEIGRKSFRVKRIGSPVFKIGSGKHIMSMLEISSQLYVRADYEDIDIDISIPIEQFTVQIFSKDTCASFRFTNTGNKISDEIKQAFRKLKPNDTVIFGNIMVSTPMEKHTELETVVISIKE